MTIGEVLAVKDFDYMIHENASKFKVMSGVDGTTVYESADLTDAKGAFDYCVTNAGINGGLVRVKKPTTIYPLSDAVTINGSTSNYITFQGVRGEAMTNVQIRPMNNTPAFIITGGAPNTSLERLYLTHNQAGYTKNLIHILDDVKHLNLSGLRFHDFAHNKGNAIGFELLTADKSQYEIFVDKMIITGFENGFYFNLQQVDTGTPSEFISSILFDKIFVWNAKRVALATGVTGAKLLALDFDKIHYQYSASNPLTAGEAVYDFGSTISQWLIRLFQCQTWDIPVGPNLINMGSSTEVLGLGCNLSHRVGGAGATKYKSLDWYNHARGEHETNGVVGQRDYNINHGLGVAPKEVYATVTNQDINNQFACIIPKNSIDATKFTVRLVGDGNIIPGTNNIKISWRAFL